MTNPRADFIPIVDRKPLTLPGDARVAVWVIVNVEEWPIHEPMARTVDACIESRWELFGHGFVQRALPREQDERAVIRQTIEVIQKKTGRKPRGWMGPGLHETFDTPDILAEEVRVRPSVVALCDGLVEKTWSIGGRND